MPIELQCQNAAIEQLRRVTSSFLDVSDDVRNEEGGLTRSMYHRDTKSWGHLETGFLPWRVRDSEYESYAMKNMDVFGGEQAYIFCYHL